MTFVIQAARTVQQGTVIAYADFRTFYTWKTWLGGWLVRLLFQAAFYGMIGVVVGATEYRSYIILGAVMMISATEPMMAVASTTWDRFAGTRQLLAATPASLGFFYIGRSLQWPLSACATTTIALFLLSPVFGGTWSAGQVPVAISLIALTSFATYAVALALGAIALVTFGARNIISNVKTMLTTAFCGVVVPVTFWADPVQWIAQGIPLTHGLAAMRALESGASAPMVAWSGLLTVLVGFAWLCVAFVAYRRVFRYARKSGTLSM